MDWVYLCPKVLFQTSHLIGTPTDVFPHPVTLQIPQGVKGKELERSDRSNLTYRLLGSVLVLALDGFRAHYGSLKMCGRERFLGVMTAEGG